jgi:hypothetical protein
MSCVRPSFKNLPQFRHLTAGFTNVNRLRRMFVKGRAGGKTKRWAVEKKIGVCLGG